MAEERKPEDETSELEPEYAPTPFDGPYFVPVLLAGMALWFAYDGFLNPERLDPQASISKYLAFNQWGSAALALAAGFSGWRAWKRQRPHDSSASSDAS